MSSDPCGCDLDAKPPHKCDDHKIRAGLLSTMEVRRAFLDWRAKLVSGGFGHADQITFFNQIDKIAEKDR
jgi:hypothetical protein